MRFKKTKEEDTTLGIAPLIDIVFLLLIFFMVTSHFDVASGIRIRLPKVGQKTYNQEKQRVNLVLAESGESYLDGKKINIDDLEKTLAEIIAERGITDLILQADIDVRHGVVVDAMDSAKSAGIRSIIIAARWKAEELL